MNLNVDTDKDGDPENDHDSTKEVVEIQYAKEGTYTIGLTVEEEWKRKTHTGASSGIGGARRRTR
jgi:PKD repeat protein